MSRTTALSVSARRPIGIALLFGILLSLTAAFFSVTPAHAAECAPDASTACVQGTMKTSDGQPAVGVSLELTGGEEAVNTETDANGSWLFKITESGTYTVTVDESTLPEGQFFKMVDSRTAEVQFTQVVGMLFPLTDDPDAANNSGGGSDNGDSAANGGNTSGSDKASAFSWPRFWQQFANGIRMGLLVALASLGLSLIFGTTGLSNFAHGEMLTMGGLLGAVFMGLVGNLIAAGALVVITMALFGWAQDKVIWKPLRKRRLSLMQMMIVSIGLSIMMQFSFQYFFGARYIRIDTSTPTTVTLGPVTMTVQSYIAMGIALAAIILVGLGLMYTRFGRATRAISDNPALAKASGIDVDRVISVVWIVGGALAGLAGLFLGLIFNGINWFTGGQLLLLFFAAVTLGGLGTAFGAFVGSMIVGMMVEISNIWLPGDLKYGTALGVMILILLVRPQGIFGRKERIG